MNMQKKYIKAIPKPQTNSYIGKQDIYKKKK